MPRPKTPKEIKQFLGKTVHKILTSLDGINVCEVNITYDNSENSPYLVKLPLSNEKFSCLQDKDLKVRQLKQKVIQGQYAQFYFIKKRYFIQVRG